MPDRDRKQAVEDRPFGLLNSIDRSFKDTRGDIFIRKLHQSFLKLDELSSDSNHTVSGEDASQENNFISEVELGQQSKEKDEKDALYSPIMKRSKVVEGAKGKH